MEAPMRRLRANQLQEQENINGLKSKSKISIPRRQAIAVRGALGELSTNVQIQRDVPMVKAFVADFDKKAKCGTLRSNYSHVQSKIDTGITQRNVIQPTCRPPLRREESTGGLATRAALTRAKDMQNKQNDAKESTNVALQAKKTEREIRKNTKLATLKENVDVAKPILKESTESLGKLKINETSRAKSVKTNHVKEIYESASPALPADIEDIDARDNSPMLMSIYIKEIYRYMMDLENKYPIEANHLRKQAVITGNMRATLIDWLVELQKQFSLILETFQMAVGIIDRYLQIVPNVPKERLQLIGVTAMFIASKYEEIYAPNVDDFVYVTDNTYTKNDIIRCEREVLNKLDFCLARPIPLTFLRRFVKAAHGTPKTHHMAKYFVDLCLVEYSMAQYHPSELAASALCLSLHLLSNRPVEDIWTPSLVYYSGCTLNHIEPIVRKIAKIVKNVDRSKHKAVYKKYLDQSLAKVSSLPQLQSDALNELAQS